MKHLPSLRHRWNAVPALAACALACVLVAAAPQAWACASNGVVLPRVKLAPQFLLPTVADRMDHWFSRYELTEGDFVFILLPNSAKVDMQGDKDNPAIERVGEGDARLAGSVRMQLNQPGYTWWLLLAAKKGSTTINIGSGAQKKALAMDVKAYAPHIVYAPPKPYTMALDQATRESPFRMSSGSDVEITLPGELKDGWSSNDAREGGVVLERAEKLSGSAGADHPQVKLTFSAPSSGYRNEPYHLVIKRGGGLFGGESFHFHVLINPAPAC